jgi:hypothetical protein
VYKKTGQSAHYLPRIGSYSTVPHRNGRVDVLPPGAEMPLYDVGAQLTDALAEIEQARARRELLEARRFDLVRFDDLRSKLGSRGTEKDELSRIDAELSAIDASLKSLRLRASKLRRLLSGDERLSVESIFFRLAEHQLPHDVYSRLVAQAQSIFGRTKR